MSSWTVSASGTQTAIISTEHTLVTDNTNATYCFQVSVGALVVGDVLELRIYTQTLNGGTYDQTWKHTIGPNTPVDVVFVSPAQPSDQGFRATLKQVAGTGRAFPWKVLRN